MADCVDPVGMFEAYAEAARALDALARRRPPRAATRGPSAPADPPDLGRVARALALPPYLLMHDPDGRPRPLRRSDDY